MRIVISGEPIQWERPGKATKGNRSWRYDTQKNAKAAVRWAMMVQWNKAFERPQGEMALEARQIVAAEVLWVNLTFLFPPNKSDSEALKNAKLWDIVKHGEKPDWDNLIKFYMDCGNNLLWSDDKIVFGGMARKGFSKKPRTIIEIMTKENLNVDAKTRKVLEIFSPDKLKEFVEDVKQFIFIYPQDIDSHSGEGDSVDKREWQTSTARLLADFANKHSADLSRVNKYKAMKFSIPEHPIC